MFLAMVAWGCSHLRRGDLDSRRRSVFLVFLVGWILIFCRRRIDDDVVWFRGLLWREDMEQFVLL